MNLLHFLCPTFDQQHKSSSLCLSVAHSYFQPAHPHTDFGPVSYIKDTSGVDIK